MEKEAVNNKDDDHDYGDHDDDNFSVHNLDIQAATKAKLFV